MSAASASAASSSSVAGDHLVDRAVLDQVGGLDRAGGEVERAHQVLGDQPGHVGGGAERALLDLGYAEVGVVAGHHDVGVADQTDAAAEAEAVDRGDHRDAALVDRLERGVAALVGADQGVEAGGVLHLLDVDARVEPAALGAQHHDVGLQVGAGLVERGRDVEPALHGQRVDRRGVHRDDPDVVVPEGRADCHGTPVARPTKQLLGRVPAMALPIDLSGRVVLVTGGTKGIGLGITAGLPRGRRHGGDLRPLRGDAAGGTTHHVCDVRDPEAVRALVDGDRRAPRPARRPGQQRRGSAERRRGHGLAALPRQDRRRSTC